MLSLGEVTKLLEPDDATCVVSVDGNRTSLLNTCGMPVNAATSCRYIASLAAAAAAAIHSASEELCAAVR